MKSQRKEIVDDFCKAVTNTPSLDLQYIFPDGWDDIDGRQFFRIDFKSLRLYIMVLYVNNTQKN